MLIIPYVGVHISTLCGCRPTEGSTFFSNQLLVTLILSDCIFWGHHGPHPTGGYKQQNVSFLALFQDPIQEVTATCGANVKKISLGFCLIHWAESISGVGRRIYKAKSAILFLCLQCSIVFNSVNSVQMCLMVSNLVQNCSKLFDSVQQCSIVFNSVQQCLIVFNSNSFPISNFSCQGSQRSCKYQGVFQLC